MKYIIVFVFAVLMVFSMVSYTAAQNMVHMQSYTDSRPQIRQSVLDSLPAETLERISNLGRDALRYLEGLSAEEIVSLLGNMNVGNAPRASLLIKRVVQNQEQIRERYQTARENYISAKRAYTQARERFQNRLTEYQACSEDETGEGCDDVLAQSFEDAQEYALNVAESLIEHINKLIERVNEAENLPEDIYNAMIEELNGLLDEVEVIKADIEAALTIEDLEGPLGDLKDITQRIRHRHAYQLSNYAAHQANGLLVRMEILRSRGERILAYLEENGVDITDVEDDFETFDSKLVDAEVAFHDALDKFNEARDLRHSLGNDTNETNSSGIMEQITSLSREAKDMFKQSINLLKEAHDILKDIIKEVRSDLRQLGTNDGEELLDPETEVNDEISETDEDGNIEILEDEEGFIAEPVAE